MVKENTTTPAQIRILHLILSLECGGAERIVASIVSQQQRAAAASDFTFAHQVCCLDRIGKFGTELQEAGHQVHLLPRRPGIDWLLPFKLARLLRREGIDILHAHGESAWFYGSLACLLDCCGPSRCLTTIHGYGADRSSLPSYNLWRFLTAISRKVILVADNFRQELLEKGFPGRKLRTILNGVQFAPSPFSRQQLQRLFALRQTDQVIGITARLSPVKNHSLLFHALQRLRRERDDIVLLVVGDGPERQRLFDLAQNLKVAEAIHFTGERHDATDLLPLFDIFVLPSFSEGISMTLLEAMAARVPVIASAVGGNTEIIRHRQSGLLFASDNLDDLLDNLRLLLNDAEKRRKLGENGAAEVEKKYSFQRMLNQYEELYAEISN